MPTLKHYYKCDYCTQKFPTYDACLQHECDEHIHISIDKYHQWQKLQDTVVRAGSTISHTKNEQTQKEFDDAVEALIKFENKVINKQGINNPN